MAFVSRNWVTSLAVINGGFLLFLAVALGMNSSDSTASERVFGLATMGVAGLALLAGLWGLRSGRWSRSVSYAGVVVGVIGTLVWFWMVIPPILALVVLWFGVVRNGLAREANRA
jgi:hypothetical protein